MPILIDSNVILDIATKDPIWGERSSRVFAEHASHGYIANAIIYAEICCDAESSGDVDRLLSEMEVRLSDIPREALFLAAKAHLSYRRRGGTRSTGLPDFFIGAHAQVLGISVMTRDEGRYPTYFPGVTLISPAE
jgi:predicted nucleic acid-binding protein